MLNKQAINEESFHFGRDGEQSLMTFFRGKGLIMIEVGALREKLGEGGAPMIYLPKEYKGKTKLVSPDFFGVNVEAILQGKTDPRVEETFIWTKENIWTHPFLWCEVKTKNGCSYGWICRCWQTGIDGYLLRQYLMVQHQVKIPLLLFFLQIGTSTAQKNAPGICPTGLYACPVTQKPDITHPKGSSIEKASMVYWSVNNLICLATLEELLSSGKNQSWDGRGNMPSSILSLIKQKNLNNKF